MNNTNNKNKNKSNTHSFADFSLALARFIPRLPQFLINNFRLKSAKVTDRGSTGFILERVAAKHPDQIFLHFEGQQYTYAQFNARVNQLAHALKRKGVREGDCVAVMFENSPELIASVFAINKLGAIAGMINYQQRGSVLAHSFNTIRPKALIASPECMQGLSGAEALLEGNMKRFTLAGPLSGVVSGTVPGSEVIPGTPATQDESVSEHEIQSQQNKQSAGTTWYDIGLESLTESQENLPETKDITLGQQCFYVFTSGTTGLPKAAAMTHLRWYKAGIAFGRMALGLRPGDVQHCSSPLYHNTALSISLSSVLNTASTLVLARKFSASNFWKDVMKHKVTNVVYIGELCRYLLNQDVQPEENQHQVRAFIGNGLRTELWDTFQQRFGIKHIYELYGASEGNAGFVNVFNLKRTVGFSPMTFSIVRFDVESEQPVLDAQGRFQKVRKGETGLLMTEVSPKAPFDGYTNNREASDAKLLRNVFKQGDCWFNTGDLVRRQGFRHIAFVDRVGDTFRWKSENVATTEVEAHLQSLRGVAEAVVYGVQVPKTEGRAGMASVILERGKRFDPQGFYRELKSRLPDYAVPLFVRLNDAHDITGTFKIKKAQLKKEGYRVYKNLSDVFVLVDRAEGYQPLNEQLLDKIESGKLRF